MRQSFELRVIVGLLIWIGLISAGILYARKSLTRSPDAIAQLGKYVSHQRHSVEINFPIRTLLAVGDPVFEQSNDAYTPIGYVSRVESKESTETMLSYTSFASVTFYSNAPQFNAQDFLEYHSAAESTSWVLRTMLPPEKRAELTKLIMDAYAKNQDEIVGAIRPIIEDSLRKASQIVKDDLKKAFERREEQLRKVGQKYQAELIQEEIVPLVENEIWPIVQEAGQPLATQIGNEIWQEISVFRFGWRYIYDRSPLPKKELTAKEFDRFMEEKALPILKSHVDEFVAVQQDIIAKVAKNEEVKKTISDSVKKVVNDPDVQELFAEVFQEVFIDNERLKKSMEDHWNSPKAKIAVGIASRRLEPTITEIGIAMFGSPSTEITPEFARVLRHRILHKDSRWLTLHVADPEATDAVDAAVAENKSETASSVRPTLPLTLEVKFAPEAGVIPYEPARNAN